MSEGLNERRREKGLRPRPVRAAVVGFPNVGKSALINRLIGRAQCASAGRPGVTRHLQWVSLGAEGAIMLLDAPGVLPMRLADQAAAVRLAICNDIGEASYTTSLVAAQFVELLRANTTPSTVAKRMAALEARYRVSPEGLTGEAYVVALAERDGDGDEERAGRRLLKDYQEGRLGNFCLEQPPREAAESTWDKDGPTRREVRIAAQLLR